MVDSTHSWRKLLYYFLNAYFRPYPVIQLKGLYVLKITESYRLGAGCGSVGDDHGGKYNNQYSFFGLSVTHSI